jgi:hypothetical protein
LAGLVRFYGFLGFGLIRHSNNWVYVFFTFTYGSKWTVTIGWSLNEGFLGWLSIKRSLN